MPEGFSALCETLRVGSEEILDHGRRIADLERKVSELYQRIGQAEPVSDQGPTFASDRPTSADAHNDPRLITLIEAGEKIQAIKLYRELTGAGLADAKDEIDRIETMGPSSG